MSVFENLRKRFFFMLFEIPIPVSTISILTLLMVLFEIVYALKRIKPLCLENFKALLSKLSKT